MKKKNVRVLLIGDVMGAPGRMMFQKHISKIKHMYNADAVIVNGENSDSSGRGITSRIANSFKHNGADVITTGNHIWARKEVYSYLDEHDDILRPANFPSACPGKGVTTFEVNGCTIGVINVQGQVYMREMVDSPFKITESLLTYLKSKTNIIIVDFHAEATSEKMALGYFLDGKVSAVVGTHTHVQTADERVLPEGTAFITDLGMTGPLESMIGMKKEAVINRFLTQLPTRFEVEDKGPMVLCGVCVDIDATTGCALDIQRIRVVDHEIMSENK